VSVQKGIRTYKNRIKFTGCELFIEDIKSYGISHKFEEIGREASIKLLEKIRKDV
jgi:hypothetical protein